MADAVPDGTLPWGKITKIYPWAHQGILIKEFKDYYGNTGKI